jgi:hypothetical protein
MDKTHRIRNRDDALPWFERAHYQPPQEAVTSDAQLDGNMGFVAGK